MNELHDAFPARINNSEGLSKLEYAAIHICSGLSANSQFGHELDVAAIAEMAVNQAKALCEELKKSTK